MPDVPSGVAYKGSNHFHLLKNSHYCYAQYVQEKTSVLTVVEEKELDRIESDEIKAARSTAEASASRNPVFRVSGPLKPNLQ